MSGRSLNNGAAVPNRDPLMRRLEILISNVLRTGVIASVALIILGMLLMFIQHPGYINTPDEMRHLVGPDARFPRSVDVLIAGVLKLQGEAIVVLGLLVLAGTPVTRVVVSTAAFIKHRDRVYAAITATVLCLL